MLYFDYVIPKHKTLTGTKIFVEGISSFWGIKSNTFIFPRHSTSQIKRYPHKFHTFPPLPRGFLLLAFICSTETIFIWKDDFNWFSAHLNEKQVFLDKLFLTLNIFPSVWCNKLLISQFEVLFHLNFLSIAICNNRGYVWWDTLITEMTWVCFLFTSSWFMTCFIQAPDTSNSFFERLCFSLK